ncbi:hypothetical protein HPB48_009235 [Haemaphysalis longicornis]|uniref:HMG box domain-containing protein n=1 Tax=Haemaphysalis longicornis TaxID=44386 RepID=A0A9J6FYH9_HAELO|nr:hypothetical protein HPB48_009235 [Haemaphysalis longicornis]
MNKITCSHIPCVDFAITSPRRKCFFNYTAKEEAHMRPDAGNDNGPAAATDIAEPSDSKKKAKWPAKSKRRKRARDVNAPEKPLTGYVRFLNDRREAVRAANPTANFSDITKILANEWSKLGPQEKQASSCLCSVHCWPPASLKYLDEAEKDRVRYSKEMEQYQQTEAYKMFTKKQHEKKAAKGDDGRAATTNGTAADQTAVCLGKLALLAKGAVLPCILFSFSSQVGHEDGKKDDVPGFEIPIFTEEFLDHNKGCEAELRQLRKSNTEYEEQNAILSKHVDTMRAAVEKLETETTQQRHNNRALHQHLAALRSALARSFAALPLPGTNETAALENIDNYMAKLHSIILDRPQEHEALISSVRDIANRLEYQG